MGCASSSSSSGPGGLSAAADFEEARRWRDEAVAYRQRFKASMARSQALVTRRPDVYCELLEEPWRPGEHYDVGDLFHSTFKKSSMEINIAFKGGRFKRHALFYNYGRSIVLVLKSKASGSVCSACLLVAHTTGAGDVFEMIWFATRQKKQNAGLGTCLFRRCCQATSASGAKALVITANDNVACWWMSLSVDVKTLRLHPTVIRSAKDASGIKRAAEKGHNRRMGKVPKFFVSAGPDGVVNGFYETSVGAPFRYDGKNTTHVWYVKADGVGGGGGPVGGAAAKRRNSKDDSKANARRGSGIHGGGVSSSSSSSFSSSSKYRVRGGGGRKMRPSFRTAGTVVKGAVRFKQGAHETPERQAGGRL